VICVHVRVQERCAHGTPLNGQRQPEREHSANHVAILYQNLPSVF
jgi:hypothetical protein